MRRLPPLPLLLLFVVLANVAVAEEPNAIAAAVEEEKPEQPCQYCTNTSMSAQWLKGCAVGCSLRPHVLVDADERAENDRCAETCKTQSALTGDELEGCQDTCRQPRAHVATMRIVQSGQQVTHRVAAETAVELRREVSNFMPPLGDLMRGLLFAQNQPDSDASPFSDDWAASMRRIRERMQEVFSSMNAAHQVDEQPPHPEHVPHPDPSKVPAGRQVDNWASSSSESLDHPILAIQPVFGADDELAAMRRQREFHQAWLRERLRANEVMLSRQQQLRDERESWLPRGGHRQVLIVLSLLAFLTALLALHTAMMKRRRLQQRYERGTLGPIVTAQLPSAPLPPPDYRQSMAIPHKKIPTVAGDNFAQPTGTPPPEYHYEEKPTAK